MAPRGRRGGGARARRARTSSRKASRQRSAWHACMHTGGRMCMRTHQNKQWLVAIAMPSSPCGVIHRHAKGGVGGKKKDRERGRGKEKRERAIGGRRTARRGSLQRRVSGARSTRHDSAASRRGVPKSCNDWPVKCRGCPHRTTSNGELVGHVGR